MIPSSSSAWHAFSGIDWFMLAVYASVVLGIGFYYARQQRTTEEYLVGGRGMHPFLAGISMYTATTSIISYIGTPGEYVQYGPVLAVFASVLIIPFVQLIIGRYFIPVIMKLPITSAYEILGGRLGLSVQRTGSICYMATRFVWMSLILFTCATVMVNVTGCDPHWRYVFVLVVGIVTTTYTLFGGIRAVMITEVLQFFMLLLGALLTLLLITFRVGLHSWIPNHWESYWPSQPVFSLNPHVRVTLVMSVVYYLIASVCQYGSDQSTIQRLLTTRDAPSAGRAFLLNNIANASVTVILALVGAALIGFYRLNPQAGPPGMTLAHNGDAFFPYYISHELPRGVSGLVVASLLAMAMSCLSAGINALITIFLKDFVETSKGGAGMSEAGQLRVGRWVAIVVGFAVVAGCLIVGKVPGDVVEMSSKTVNLLPTPMFGLFVLAIFVPSATAFGAIMGAIYSTTAAVLIGYWDVLTGRPAVSFLWMAPIALAICIGGGWLFSRLPTKGRSARAIASYTMGSLALLAVLVTGVVEVFKEVFEVAVDLRATEIRPAASLAVARRSTATRNPY